MEKIERLKLALEETYAAVNEVLADSPSVRWLLENDVMASDLHNLKSTVTIARQPFLWRLLDVRRTKDAG